MLELTRYLVLSDLKACDENDLSLTDLPMRDYFSCLISSLVSKRNYQVIICAQPRRRVGFARRG